MYGSKAGAALAMMYAAMAGSVSWGDGQRDRSKDYVKLDRPCLRCKKPHRHNNSFCSAECCRLWTAERKSGVAANNKQQANYATGQAGQVGVPAA